MPNNNIPVLVDDVLSQTFRLGIWEEKELPVQQFWIYVLLTSAALSLIAGYTIFSTFGASKYEERSLTAEDELHIRKLLVEYGEQDSLGYFATRRDKRAIFASDRKAAITYRIVGGVSLASADPIGSENSWPAAIRDWRREAVANGLIPAVLACSERGARRYEQHGLRVLELGDEAIIDVQGFWETNRQRAPLLKAARRLHAAGFKARARRQKDIPEIELQQIRIRSEQWREAEGQRRGFSMALSRLGEAADERCVLVTALSPEGSVQGVLSLVPWGRHGLSLDFMCTNRSSQSGLCEFMIHELVAASPGLGVLRISLNFVMFRSIFEQAGRLGAGAFILGYRSLLRLLSRVVQLESLYRFTVKCDPQWQTKFSCIPRVIQVPRITWMSLTAEGYLPYWGRISTQHGEAHTDNFICAVQDINKGLSGAKTETALSWIEKLRHDKLNLYRTAGYEPYMSLFSPDSRIASIRKQFCELSCDTSSGKSCKLAGRIMAKREMGKVCFLALSDFTGHIQAILDSRRLGRTQFKDMVRQIDTGDLLGVKGEISKSKKGELSVLVFEWVLTAKCLNPLPGKYAGAVGGCNQEQLSLIDLMTCQESRMRIYLKSCVMSALRACLAQQDFLEVEPPPGLLQKRNPQEDIGISRGSAQKSPYLHNGDGLYPKRLCAAGMSRVFKFSRSTCKTQGQASDEEITILDVFQTYKSYLGTLDMVRQLVQQAAYAVYGREILRQQTSEGIVEVDIAGQWPITTVHTAVATALNAPITTKTPHDEIIGACNLSGVETPVGASNDQLVMCAFEQQVIPKTEPPTFYIDYPLSCSPFTRQHKNDAGLAERWSLVAFGVEIGTGSSELTDPIEYQRQLHIGSNVADSHYSNFGDLEAELLRVLEYGMPPTSSFKLTIGRLLTILVSSNGAGG